MAEVAAKQTPTEFLIGALEEIEGAEDVVLIVRRKGENGKDEIDWRANDVPAWKLVGMVEFAKLDIFANAEVEED